MQALGPRRAAGSTARARPAGCSRPSGRRVGAPHRAALPARGIRPDYLPRTRRSGSPGGRAPTPGPGRSAARLRPGRSARAPAPASRSPWARSQCRPRLRRPRAGRAALRVPRPPNGHGLLRIRAAGRLSPIGAGAAGRARRRGWPGSPSRWSAAAPPDPLPRRKAKSNRRRVRCRRPSESGPRPGPGRRRRSRGGSGIPRPLAVCRTGSWSGPPRPGASARGPGQAARQRDRAAAKEPAS